MTARPVRAWFYEAGRQLRLVATHNAPEMVGFVIACVLVALLSLAGCGGAQAIPTPAAVQSMICAAGQLEDGTDVLACASKHPACERLAGQLAQLELATLSECKAATVAVGGIQ